MFRMRRHGFHAPKRSGHVRDSVEPIVGGEVLGVRQRVIELDKFVGAGAVATGFSYPFEAVLLKSSKFRFVESSLVERACAGRGPMFAVTVGAFDGVEPRLCLGGGGVG